MGAGAIGGELAMGQALSPMPMLRYRLPTVPATATANEIVAHIDPVFALPGSMGSMFAPSRFGTGKFALFLGVDLFAGTRHDRIAASKQPKQIADQLWSAQVLTTQGPILGIVHQLRVTQNGQMLRDIRLAHLQQILNVVHALYPVHQLIEDHQASRMRTRFQQLRI